MPDGGSSMEESKEDGEQGGLLFPAHGLERLSDKVTTKNSLGSSGTSQAHEYLLLPLPTYPGAFEEQRAVVTWYPRSPWSTCGLNSQLVY